ncbi:MAG: COX15/CtaA family protein [Acidimicrobiia bacterium]
MTRRLVTYAWIATGLSVAVIAGGAIVRATGSGAGCGSHWPQCNGSVVPEGTTESIIEFTHRLTSGLAFLAAIWLFMLARRVDVVRVRRAAGAALLFMVGEVAIGAALVLGEWVGDDASVARAVIDGFHLVNTLFLLAALALTAWWAGGGPPIRLRRQSSEGRLLVWGLGALLVVAAAGALTALGDTLFPDASITDDLSSGSHFLVRLRVLHPILAVATAVYLVVVTRRLAANRRGFQGSLALLVGSIVGFQVIVGIVNLALGAPVWMQVVHVVVTDALWISAVVLTAAELAVERVPAA